MQGLESEAWSGPSGVSPRDICQHLYGMLKAFTTLRDPYPHVELHADTLTPPQESVLPQMYLIYYKKDNDWPAR